MTETDRGLQAERTRLAWRRTTLAATVVPLLAVGRVVASDGQPWVLAGAAAVALLWVAVLLVSHQRIRELARVRPMGTVRSPERDRGDRPRAPAALALLAAAVAVLAILLVGGPGAA